MAKILGLPYYYEYLQGQMSKFPPNNNYYDLFTLYKLISQNFCSNVLKNKQWLLHIITKLINKNSYNFDFGESKLSASLDQPGSL